MQIGETISSEIFLLRCLAAPIFVRRGLAGGGLESGAKKIKIAFVLPNVDLCPERFDGGSDPGT